MAAVSGTSGGVHPPFQLEPCPHCGANTELSAHTIYRYQCRLCGGARIPVNRNVTRTPPEVLTLLKHVRKRHIARGAWKAAANTLWVMATLTGLLGLGLSRAFDFQTLGITLVSLFTLIPVVVGFLSKRASNRALAESKRALTNAWSTMASHVCALLGGKFTEEDLKSAFGVDSESALVLVAEAEVAQLLDDARRDVANPPAEAPRVRIAESLTEEEVEQRELDALRKELGHK